MSKYLETAAKINTKDQQPLANKHIIALINYLALVPLVYFIPQWVNPFLPDNKFLKVCVDVVIIVPIIAYVVMPISLKKLSSP
ncbi:hypothetical protein [Thalassotalea sp. PLHSN55]|uniref:hypothetical protein n=1 Tax=Thalassotalea sp. PLHSN55 TaxID=3435888 RepID=UPI003F853E3D